LGSKWSISLLDWVVIKICEFLEVIFIISDNISIAIGWVVLGDILKL
jgi:hypothetical protein